MSEVTIGSASHVGQKRTENQDYHAYFSPDNGQYNRKGLLVALADGMGGHAGGAKASKTAVDTLLQEYYRMHSPDVPESLEAAFRIANEKVHATGQSDEKFKGMGSTLTAVVIRKGRMYFAHVGDSRGYLIDDSRISQFTEDHSYVASLVKAGAIRPEEAKHHPEGNIITRAIGIKPEIEVDVADEPIALKQDQYILLCCDGLWGQIPDTEIHDTIRQYREPDDICEKLVEKANDSGGPDNITVVVVRIDHVQKMAGLVDRFMNLVR